jgi:hypothetical protein
VIVAGHEAIRRNNGTIFFWPTEFHQGKNHILAVMQQIQKNLRLTNTTFMAQYRRRKELETLLIAKRPETEKLKALVLLEKHPEVYQQIDSFKALYNHLSIWEK